jgi:hypothetical protein
MRDWRNWVTAAGVIGIIIFFGLTGCAKRPTPAPEPDPAVPVVVVPDVPATTFVTAQGQRILAPDGKPLFWIVDTAWQLCEKLTITEIDQYATVRKAQGFNCIMFNASGAWWVKAGVGRPELWNKLGDVLTLLEAKGMYAIPCVQWTEYNAAGKPYLRFTPAECQAMATSVGTLFRDRRNLLFWLVGGLDDYAACSVSTVRMIGTGFRSGDPNHLIAYHPRGKHLSTEAIAAGPDNQVPLYHSFQEMDARTIAAQLRTLDATGLPFANVEPCYEGTWGQFSASAADVAAVAGVCASMRVSGMAYGHHSVWGFTPGKWKAALSAPGVARFIAATRQAPNNQ